MDENTRETCEKMLILINAAIDNEATADEIAMLEKHIKSCEMCKTLYDDALALETSFKALRDERDAGMPGNITEKIMAAVLQEPEKIIELPPNNARKWFDLKRRRLVASICTVAAAAVMITVVSMSGSTILNMPPQTDDDIITKSADSFGAADGDMKQNGIQPQVPSPAATRPSCEEQIYYADIGSGEASTAPSANPEMLMGNGLADNSAKESGGYEDYKTLAVNTADDDGILWSELWVCDSTVSELPEEFAELRPIAESNDIALFEDEDLALCYALEQQGYALTPIQDGGTPDGNKITAVPLR